MDAHDVSVFDNVKFEKAKAMARFNRFRKIRKLLQFLEVLVALILISWSSTKLPRAVRLSGNFLFELAGYIFNHHVVFLIGNAIIVSLFILCRENDAGNQNSGSGNIYDDYLRHSQAQQPKVSDSVAGKVSPQPAETKETTTASDDDDMKQIVCVPSEEKAEQRDAVATAIQSATKQIQKFQTTQSTKLKRDIAMRPRAELRRSETATEQHRDEKQVMTSFDSVERLSDEEFNLTVDAFIKRHQESLKEQKLVENEQLNTLTKITRTAAALH